MARENPSDGHSNPSQIRSLHEAIEQSVATISTIKERQAQHGKRWVLSYRRTITPTQNAFYIYIDNPSSYLLDIDGVNIYTNGSLLVDLYDEPTVDTSTFTSNEFRNTRSSVRKDPPWNAYSGTENNVTISDSGREFSVDFFEAGRGNSIGEGGSAPGYIVDPSSSALIKFTNDTSGDIQVAFTVHFNEQITAPDLTTLEGMN